MDKSTETPEIKTVLTMMEKLLHWAAIIESSDDAIISKSIEGNITSWNKGAERLYGYTAEEIVGQPVSLLMPPNKKDDFPFIMKQLHDGKRVEHYETERMTKDGKRLYVSITVSPIRDSKGIIIGASKIARNITQKVEEDKRREEFVSTASHELKTPLTSQKAFGELLERLIDQHGYTELKPYIEKINRQTNKLTKLTDDLLQISRLKDGKLKIVEEPFAIDEVINEMVENIQMTTRYTVIKNGKTGKMINGDSERIGQAITNLLSNARKYSPDNNKIIVSTSIKGNSVLISIQDFGIGIEKKYFDDIFTRFFRVSGENEKTFPGMGIGLHLCKEIINRHGGEIWVESEMGKGSTFFFTLPYLK